MPLLLATIVQAGTSSTTTASSAKSSGSSAAPLLIIVAIFAVVYFLFIRPRQQRMRQQQSAGKQLSVGDEVMTAGGIFGRVVALDADQVEVEVSPGVVMTFLRRAINPRPPSSSGPPPAPDEPEDAPWEVPGTPETHTDTEAGGAPPGAGSSPFEGPATGSGHEEWPPEGPFRPGV
jgi:preprotein translocase subunit YajC